MKLYEYIIRRLLLMVLVLFAVSVIVFYLTRGPLPPGSVLAPYITPRLTSLEKLQLAQSLGVATHKLSIVLRFYQQGSRLHCPALPTIFCLAEASVYR